MQWDPVYTINSNKCTLSIGTKRKNNYFEQMVTFQVNFIEIAIR